MGPNCREPGIEKLLDKGCHSEGVGVFQEPQIQAGAQTRVENVRWKRNQPKACRQVQPTQQWPAAERIGFKLVSVLHVPEQILFSLS
jgi:hypothetical protein